MTEKFPSKERPNPFKPESFDMVGSGALVIDGFGNLYVQLRDQHVKAEPNKLSVFGGAREKHAHRGRPDIDEQFPSKELTAEAAKREVMEELSLKDEQIESVKPFGWQSYNSESEPSRGFSVHVVQLKEGVGFEEMHLTEGKAVVKIDDIDHFLNNYKDQCIPSIWEMLDRNRDRIRDIMERGGQIG